MARYSTPCFIFRPLSLALLLLFCRHAFGAQLQPKTLQGFEQYASVAEKRMEQYGDPPAKFLYIESFPAAKREAVIASLRAGEVYVVRLVSDDEDGKPLRAPGGWINHWLAAMFIPDVTLAQVAAADQQYGRYQDFYRPDIIRSSLLWHKDGDFHVYVRVQKKTPWLTVTLDAFNNIRYHYVDAKHMYTVARSYRIQQVDHPGMPDERVLPQGRGDGILWAVNTYWRYEQTRGGVLVESETITLSRSIPLGLGWIIKPYIRNATLATVKHLMTRTRTTLLAEVRESTHTAPSARGKTPAHGAADSRQ